MPRLTIVIPFVGKPQQLENTLVSVLENRPADCEVIVVRSGRYEDPYDLSDEVRFIEAPGADPVVSLTVGIEAARSPLIHILDCGVEVVPGWTDAALPRFHDSQVAAVAPVVVTGGPEPRVLSAGVDYHRSGVLRYLRAGADAAALGKGSIVLGPDPAAGFYRRSALGNVGRLIAALGPTGAMVDLALALREAGWQTVLEPASQVVDARPARGARSAMRQSLEAERLFWRRAVGRGRLTSVALHGLVVVAEVCLSLPGPSAITRLTGRIAGWLTRPLPYASERSSAEPDPSISSGRAIARPHFLDSQAGRQSASPIDRMAG